MFSYPWLLPAGQNTWQSSTTEASGDSQFAALDASSTRTARALNSLRRSEQVGC